MEQNNSTSQTQENYVDGRAWYSQEGPFRDVVVSTRVRFARNLASFPFVRKLKNDEKEQVMSIVFDGFSNLISMGFHAIPVNRLSLANAKILSERGILRFYKENSNLPEIFGTGVLVSYDGKTSCVVNCDDHIHLAHCESGLDFEKCFDECKKIDLELQEKIQFSADYNFGYLSSFITETGSAMRCTARICIPNIVVSGNLPQISKYCVENGCVLEPAFFNEKLIDATGYFYHVCTKFCVEGTEIDHIANINSVCRYIVEYERKILGEYVDNRLTVIKNSAFRAYSVAKFSMFLTLKEAIRLVSEIKLGIEAKVLVGVDKDSLYSLLYRAQDGHILFLLQNGKFDFEKDVSQNEILKIDRLRAIAFQEEISNLKIAE